MKVEQGGHLVRVGITFPAHYPNGAAPSFIFDKSTTIDMSVQQDLNRVSVTKTEYRRRGLVRVYYFGGGAGCVVLPHPQ